jgi:TolB-like protein/tetratricopeptide (TPR) repeat protein
MTEGQAPEGLISEVGGSAVTRKRLALLSKTLTRIKGPIAAIAAIGAIVSGLVGYWNAYRTVRESVVVTTVSPNEQPIMVPTTDAGPLSIVVLPFDSVNTEAAQVIADGLTVSITSDLSRIRDAFIIGASTAQTFRSKNMTAQQIGKDLGVHFVLQGNVQSVGTKIRVNAALIDTGTNGQLWSETFDGDTTDIFALQDRVTTLISNSMGHEMVIRAASESERRKNMPNVADLVLRARALIEKQTHLESLKQQEAIWRQVLALDPNNTSALYFLAVARNSEIFNFPFQLDDNERRNATNEIIDLSDRLSAIDSESLWSISLQSSVALLQGDVNKSLKLRLQQLDITPKDPDIYFTLAIAYDMRLEPERVIESCEKQFALDPRFPGEQCFNAIARAEIMRGNFDSAIKWALKARTINPNRVPVFQMLPVAYALKGQMSEAKAEVASTFRRDPNYSVTRVVALLNRSTYPAAYRNWMMENYVPALRLAGFPE